MGPVAIELRRVRVSAPGLARRVAVGRRARTAQTPNPQVLLCVPPPRRDSMAVIGPSVARLMAPSPALHSCGVPWTMRKQPGEWHATLRAALIGSQAACM